MGKKNKIKSLKSVNLHPEVQNQMVFLYPEHY